MSHANAALTPRARLRLARLVVDQGWPIARAAERYDVSWPTAKRWADRYRQLGPAGMDDASSRPHRSPNRTPRRWCARSCTCAGSSGSGRCRSPTRSGCAPSTVHAVLVRCRLNRLSHLDRATGEPIRRYEHDHPGSTDPRRRQEARQHPRRRRLALRGPPAGRPEPDRAPRHAPAPRTSTTNAKVGTAFVHTVIDDHSRVAYAEIHDDETAATATGVLRRAVAWFAARGVIVERVLSDNGSAYRSPSCGATPAPSSASPPRRPGPTDPRPTARSNASTAPWPTAGRSRSSTTPSQPAAQLCQHGSTTTTTTGPTPRSAGQHPSPG